MTSPAISGVYCAAATPITGDDTPDHAAFATHCKLLLEEGCHGLALLGTTGEANSFSLQERITILDRLINAGIPASTLLPGTSTPNVAETVTLIRHAVDMGVKAVVVLPPYYYKGVSDEGLFRFYSHVITRVSRAELRIILYHIPPISSIPLSNALIARLITAFPGVVVGIKDSSGKLDSMISLAETFPGFSVLAGADPFMLPLLRAGGAGCITSSSNLIARDLRIVFDNWGDPAKADMVETAQARIDTWRNLTNAYVQLPTVKAMIAKRRGTLGWRHVRPPLVELSDTECESVWGQMAALEDQERKA